MRPNVAKHLPVLRKQADQRGWRWLRNKLAHGETKFLSGKDRREAIKILDEENK